MIGRRGSSSSWLRCFAARGVAARVVHPRQYPIPIPDKNTRHLSKGRVFYQNTRPPDTHLSWVGCIPIPTHTRVLVGYDSGIILPSKAHYFAMLGPFWSVLNPPSGRILDIFGSTHVGTGMNSHPYPTPDTRENRLGCRVYTRHPPEAKSNSGATRHPPTRVHFPSGANPCCHHGC